MKQVLVTIVILIALSFSANAKSIVKDTESFTISTNDVSTVDLNVEKSWTIEYSDANKSIQVFKVTTKKGEEYIVRNQFFEVRYSNTEKGFGARKIKGSQSKVDYTITENVINTEEVQKQAVLSSKKLNEEKALSYIAGFVPYLLNENYKHLLN